MNDIHTKYPVVKGSKGVRDTTPRSRELGMEPPEFPTAPYSAALHCISILTPESTRRAISEIWPTFSAGVFIYHSFDSKLEQKTADWTQWESV